MFMMNRIEENKKKDKEFIKKTDEEHDKLKEKIKMFLIYLFFKHSITMLNDFFKPANKKDVLKFKKEVLKTYNDFAFKKGISVIDLMKYKIMFETMKTNDKISSLIKAEIVKRAFDELKFYKATKDTKDFIKKEIGNIIEEVYKGSTLSQKVWINTNEQIRILQRGLEKTLIYADDSKKWRFELNKFLINNNADFNSRRLAITEISRVQNEVLYQSFKKEGIEKYVWLAEDGACPICEDLNGQVFDIDDDIKPPEHPFCRCSIYAYGTGEYI